VDTVDTERVLIVRVNKARLVLCCSLEYQVLLTKTDQAEATSVEHKDGLRGNEILVMPHETDVRGSWVP
jgi:hypothetical protein